MSMAKRLICLAWLALLAAGCSPEPPRSGGRTASAWAKALQEPNVEMRRKAAIKLGPLAQLDDAAIPALLGALKDADPEVRTSAARSLGIYAGPKGSEVLPALSEVQQNDADRNVRQAAAKAIEHLKSSP
jgi:HEAT repeat protein